MCHFAFIRALSKNKNKKLSLSLLLTFETVASEFISLYLTESSVVAVNHVLYQ